MSPRHVGAFGVRDEKEVVMSLRPLARLILPVLAMAVLLVPGAPDAAAATDPAALAEADAALDRLKDSLRRSRSVNEQLIADLNDVFEAYQSLAGDEKPEVDFRKAAEKEFLKASLWSLAAAVLAFFGIIHTYMFVGNDTLSVVGWAAGGRFAFGYFCFAAVFAVFHFWQGWRRGGELPDELG